MYASHPGGSEDTVLGCILIKAADIFRYGAGKQFDVLGQIANVIAEFFWVPVAQV